MGNEEPADFYRIVKRRRSVRSLSGEVAEETIKKLIHTASMAPSAHNSQPWRFVCIRNEDKKSAMLDEMSEAWRQDLIMDGLSREEAYETVQNSQKKIRDAPFLILVCLTMEDMESYPDESRQSAEYVMAIQSTAASIQNLLLAAKAEGLGSCWLCAPLFSKEVIKRSLSLPDHFDPQALVILGQPNAQPETPHRKDIEKISRCV